MSDLNSLQLYGRVVKDAEMKKTANGASVASFAVANNWYFKDSSGEYQQRANFFPLAIFGTFAEKMLPLLKKGQRLIVEGYVKQDKWVQNGTKRSATSIGVTRLHLLFDPVKQKGESVQGEEETFEFADEQTAEMYFDEPSEDLP